jgi:hypothetical protein
MKRVILTWYSLSLSSFQISTRPELYFLGECLLIPVFLYGDIQHLDIEALPCELSILPWARMLRLTAILHRHAAVSLRLGNDDNLGGGTVS